MRRKSTIKYLALFPLFLISCKETNIKKEQIANVQNKRISCIEVLTDSIDYSNTSYLKQEIELFKENKHLKHWLDGIVRKELSLNKVFNGMETYIVASGLLNNTTGLMSNFYDILIVDIKRDKSYSFRSLSRNNKLFYIDKGNNMNFYKIDFSESFFFNKDWNNVSFDIEKHKAFEINQSKSIVK